jgi:hypothetical protein
MGLALGACAETEVRGGGGASSNERGRGPTPGDVYASCGFVPFSDLPPDPSSFDPFEDPGELDLDGVGAEADFFDGYEWFVADRTPASLTLFGQATSVSGTDPPFASATFERLEAGWFPTGWGQCRIELTAPGWGNARFVLDPAVRHDPDSRVLSVLATEMACASGRAPEGRDVQAVILAETEDTVSVVILVEPADGDQECPGNPSFQYEVDLGSPLGERTVLDASVYPSLQRPWPPTESSLDPSGFSG